MTISRRTLGQAAFGAGLGGVLAAPFIRPAFGQERSITLAAYSGIFQENYEAVVVEPFRRANPNIKVTYFAMPNSAQTLGTMRAQKAAPQLDVAMFDITRPRRMRGCWTPSPAPNSPSWPTSPPVPSPRASPPSA
jgi:putative spermidine/putrescine transport system substrate-binding protein